MKVQLQGDADNLTAATTVVTDMTVREISDWALWMRVGGLTAETIALRTRHVRKALREVKVPWRSLTTEDLVTWLGSKSWKPNTRRSYRASLMLFFTWIQANGLRPDNPAALIPPTHVPRGLPRPTPEAVYREAVRDADDRVRLMIQLAAKCGLRRGEISRIRREDIHDGPGGHSLRVVGKGGHVRWVPLPEVLTLQLLRCPPGWIFPSPAAPAPLTPAHVGKLISRALPDGWTAHTLRHRCGTMAYQGSKDIRAVQELLGHAKSETTDLYTKVGADSIRAAMMAASA